ncbi:hypothetical protein [Nocardioides mesophilus]|uniref:Uncharacterized protein n=1 Tax=Nocardioides mesophilus TaxID=433659 RepID=A0A7G9REY9_9ACTN|nr:hypothetical protein [Nocardioides mesophilus]QNN54164.1 hypothetical protein H9L09_07315 [Nocardioides mesophilus]
MSSHAPRLALASVGIAVLAAVADWLVSAATLPYGVPVDAALFLGFAVMVLVCGLGAAWAGRRWPADTALEHAAGLLAPLVLGGVIVIWSTAPIWFRLVVLAALLGGGLLGLRSGSRDSDSGRQPRRPLRSETGSGSLEFVGVVILAAVLVTASVGVVASSSPAVKQTVFAQICRILGNECDAGQAPVNAAMKPQDCELYTAENKVSATVDVAFVRLAGGGTVQRSDKSNGEVEITLLNEGRGGAVAAAGGHGKVRFGDHSAGFDAEAEAAATVGLQSGQTYVFDNAAEADEFQRYLQGELAQDAAGSVNPVYGFGNKAWEFISGEDPPPNHGVQKEYTRFDVALEAKADVSVGFGTGAGVQASFMEAVGTEFDRGKDRDDTSDDRQTIFMQIDWSAAGNAGLPVVAGIDASHSASGVIKVTTDADGNPVQVQFVDRTSGGFQVGMQADQDSISPAGGDADAGGSGGKKPARSWNIGFTGGEDSSTVVTQTLDLDNPERQQAFADWVGAAGGTNVLASLGATTVPGVNSEDGDNITAFGDGAEGFAALMAEQSQVSVVEYDGKTWGLGLGGGVSLGLKVSADGEYEDKEAHSVKASYLGAPSSSGDRTAYDLPECVR